jgi:hypothetical protein
MIDHTGSQWPVYSAAAVWNESVAMNVGYRWYTNGCPNSNCVDFWDKDYGNTGWVGETFSSYYTGSDLFVTGSVHVDLNDYYSLTGSQLQTAVCHEMGHSIGMDHNDYTSSCLYFQDDTYVSRYPNSDDFQMLADIYYYG